MFIGAACKIVRDADIENAVAPIGHEIDPAASHAALNKTWMAGTSPAMTRKVR